MTFAALPRCTLTFTALTLACLFDVAHAAQPLSTFRDCSTCPEMVILPASPAFAIGKYEITQAEWFAVTGEQPAEFQGDRLPVETISWRDAQRFVEQLAAKTGRPYRLPTEAEWEYAARASSTTQYHFGDAATELDQYAWFIDNAEETTHPVGSKRPNAWGLHDMHGNVAEWVLDQYSEEGYPELDETTRKDPLAIPMTLYPRVVRGGGWDKEPEQCRSAAREGSTEDWIAQDPQVPVSIWYLTDALHVGFRIVRPLQTPTPEEDQAKWDKSEPVQKERTTPKVE